MCQGQTRVEQIHRNVSIIRSVIDAIVPFKADSILVVVSNPVDLLTSLAQKLSGLPVSQVLGSGTFLDSVRLRGMVANRLEARLLHHMCPLRRVKVKILTRLGCGKFDRHVRLGRRRRRPSSDMVSCYDWLHAFS